MTFPGSAVFRGSAALTIGLVVALLGAPSAQADPATPLSGLFALSPGVCSGGSVTGSFFRMILPTGNASGPFLSNSDSRCSDQSVTPLSPGSSGGLVSGQFQPQPAAAFDGAGNARSGSVTTPVRFYGVDFATATNPTDPQTGAGTAAPQLVATGGQLSGDLSALGVTWNNQVFNQGSPKPGGGLPGKTSPLRGSIDRSGNFVIEWTSQIVGGPFNNFTGLWHLAGSYRGGTALPIAAGGPVAAAPGAPAAPQPAAPPAPGAPAPVVPGAPAAAAIATDASNRAAEAAPKTRTISLPRERSAPAWVIPVLVVLGLVGVGMFFNAERIATRRRRTR